MSVTVYAWTNKRANCRVIYSFANAYRIIPNGSYAYISWKGFRHVSWLLYIINN